MTPLSVTAPRLSPFAGSFKWLVLGYAVGLAMANLAVYLMEKGQPALLYLVPLTLGPLSFVHWRWGLIRTELSFPPTLMRCFCFRGGGALFQKHVSKNVSKSKSFFRFKSFPFVECSEGTLTNLWEGLSTLTSSDHYQLDCSDRYESIFFSNLRDFVFS
jgi:hypothetical protein